MSKTIRLKHIIIFLIGLSCLFANARVAFSRPGSLLRLPSASAASNYNQYIVGFSGEATHSSDLNYSFLIKILSACGAALAGARFS